MSNAKPAKQKYADKYEINPKDALWACFYRAILPARDKGSFKKKKKNVSHLYNFRMSVRIFVPIGRIFKSLIFYLSEFHPNRSPWNGDTV